MRTGKKLKFRKSFITKKKKNLLKTDIQTKQKKPKEQDKFDCDFLHELKSRSQDSCLLNPNYAIICDFLIKFSDLLELPSVPLKDLQLMIGALGSPHPELVQIHILLLRKLKIPKIVISKKTWETALVMFCQRKGELELEAVELEKDGYASLSVSIRLEILKCLMEAQLLRNEAIKFECDNLPTEELRQDPTGFDINGKLYWTQMSEEGDLRIYCEDRSQGTWETVAQTRDHLVLFLDQLKQEKLYISEQARLDESKEKDKEKQKETEDALEKIIKEEVVQTPAPNYGCQICEVVAKTKLQLLEHYSSLHLNRQLKEKFPHLVDGTVCKLCSFDAKPAEGDDASCNGSSSEEEIELIWVHVGTIHEKINIILKDEGLGEVKEISQPRQDCDIETLISCDSIDKPSESLDELTTNLDDGILSPIKEEKDVQEKDSKETSVNKEENLQTSSQESSLRESSPDVMVTRRRSTRLNKAGVDPIIERSVKKTERQRKQRLKKDNEDKKRVERRISCKLCGSYDSDGQNTIYTCSCGNNWHKNCVTPKLFNRPTTTWKCPLCNHSALVSMFQQVLIEFDILMEQVEQRRLAQLQTVQSIPEDEEDVESVASVVAPIDVEEEDICDITQEDEDQKVDRDTVKLMVNYCESSESENGSESDDEEWAKIRNTCMCDGGGKKCLYCKRLKGCTCDGAGSCRLCVMEEKSEEETANQEKPIEIKVSSPEPQMSTTELFLLTGEAHVPNIPEEMKMFTSTGKPKKKLPPGQREEMVLVPTKNGFVQQSLPIQPRGHGVSRRGPHARPRPRPMPPSRVHQPAANYPVSIINIDQPRHQEEVNIVEDIHSKGQEVINLEPEDNGLIDPDSPAAKYYPDWVRPVNSTLVSESPAVNYPVALPDRDAGMSGQEDDGLIDPDSPAAKYFPDRVRQVIPAPAVEGSTVNYPVALLDEGQLEQASPPEDDGLIDPDSPAAKYFPDRVRQVPVQPRPAVMRGPRLQRPANRILQARAQRMMSNQRLNRMPSARSRGSPINQSIATQLRTSGYRARPVNLRHPGYNRGQVVRPRMSTGRQVRPAMVTGHPSRHNTLATPNRQVASSAPRRILQKAPVQTRFTVSRSFQRGAVLPQSRRVPRQVLQMPNQVYPRGAQPRPRLVPTHQRYVDPHSGRVIVQAVRPRARAVPATGRIRSASRPPARGRIRSARPSNFQGGYATNQQQNAMVVAENQLGNEEIILEDDDISIVEPNDDNIDIDSSSRAINQSYQDPSFPSQYQTNQNYTNAMQNFSDARVNSNRQLGSNSDVQSLTNNSIVRDASSQPYIVVHNPTATVQSQHNLINSSPHAQTFPMPATVPADSDVQLVDPFQDLDDVQFVGTADYSNEDYSQTSGDVIIEESGGRSEAYQGQNDLKQDRDLARLPPGILIRKLRKQPVVDLE